LAPGGCCRYIDENAFIALIDGAGLVLVTKDLAFGKKEGVIYIYRLVGRAGN